MQSSFALSNAIGWNTNYVNFNQSHCLTQNASAWTAQVQHSFVTYSKQLKSTDSTALLQHIPLKSTILMDFKLMPAATSLLFVLNQAKLCVDSDKPYSAIGLANSTAGAIVFTANRPELFSLTGYFIISHRRMELSDRYLSKPTIILLVSMGFHETTLQCLACRGTVRSR